MGQSVSQESKAEESREEKTGKEESQEAEEKESQEEKVMGLTAAQKDMNATFERQFPLCFACGIRFGDIWDDAVKYPRWLEKAHLLRGCNRRIDRRAIIRLCKLCHDIADGPDEPTQRDRAGVKLPKITLANMLWLKCVLDPLHFNLVWLQSIAIKKLPEPVQPADWHLKQFKKWQGCYPIDWVGR